VGELRSHRTKIIRGKRIQIQVDDLQKGMIVECRYSTQNEKGEPGKGKSKKYMLLILNKGYKGKSKYKKVRSQAKKDYAVQIKKVDDEKTSAKEAKKKIGNIEKNALGSKVVRGVPKRSKAISRDADKAELKVDRENKENKQGAEGTDNKNIEKIRQAIRKQIVKSIDKATKNPDKYMSDKKPGRIKKAAFKKKKYSYTNKKGKKTSTSPRAIARKAKISEAIQNFEDLLHENIIVENLDSNLKEVTAFERWLKIAGIDKKHWIIIKECYVCIR